MTKKLLRLICLISLCSSLVFAEDAVKPKYGPAGHPKAVPLSINNDYFRNRHNPAPDFWHLIPYYVPQVGGRMCSVASIAMVLNAARVGMALTADDKLILQDELIKKVTVEEWPAKVTSGPSTITLAQMVNVLKEGLKVYKIGFEDVEAYVAKDTSKATVEKVHQILAANEKSAKDFVVVNFIQKAATDDAEVGHVAPVGAYDVARRKVLILDPDREYYEPYWISVEDLVKGMATLDKDAGGNRGLIRVTLK